MIPKISIITPSCNQGQFLEQSILSVLKQEYPNLEYIIIDGSSTDASVEIIKKYGNDLAYWVSEPDKGQTEAINKGFAIASGEIISWLNSDDFLLPNALYSVAKKFQANPKIDFVYGDTQQVSQDGKIIYTNKIIPFDKNVLIYGRILATQPSVFFRKSVFGKIGLLNQDFEFCMDLDFWIRAFQKGLKFSHTYQTISANRFHKDTKTVNKQNILVKEHQIIHSNIGMKYVKLPKAVKNFIYFFLQKAFRLKWGIKKIIIRGDIGINRSQKIKKYYS